MKEEQFVGDDLFVEAMRDFEIPILVDGILDLPRVPEGPCKLGQGDPLFQESLRYHHGLPKQSPLKPSEVLKLWGWWFLSEFLNVVFHSESQKRRHHRKKEENTKPAESAPTSPLEEAPGNLEEEGDLIGKPLDRAYFADDPYWMSDSWLRRM
jgi:hypothetical protein